MTDPPGAIVFRAFIDLYREDPLGFFAYVMYVVGGLATWILCAGAFGIAGLALGWIPGHLVGKVSTLASPLAYGAFLLVLALAPLLIALCLIAVVAVVVFGLRG